MTGYDPVLDANKPITAGVLFTILRQFAEDMMSPRSEIIEALGYEPASTDDLGEPNGIATLGNDGKLDASQIPSIQTIAGYTPADESDIGVANGIAGLDSSGKVPASQLPSYVDDVVEVANYSNLPAPGEDSKIYVALDTGRTYRWSGSFYTEISNYSEATTSTSGLMSSTDKTKLDNTTAGVFVGDSNDTPGDNDRIWIVVDTGAQMTAGV